MHHITSHRDDTSTPGARGELFADLPDVVYRIRLGPEPHFEYMGDAITHLTGFTPQDYYDDARPPFKTVHPDDREAFTEALNDAESTRTYTFRW